MRTRAFGTALMLSLALPVLLTEAGLAVIPGAERAAFAQADPATEVARQRYEEGVKLFDAGRFDDARAAFLQAYALKRHPAVLMNLGQSEIKSGHAEDGGNHLQQFLREFTTATPDQRAAAEKGIAEAKKKTAFVIVIVDANGADVSVDGVAIGRAPLLDPYFVKPGKHTVLATYQSKSATTQVDAKAGSAAAANLTLGTSGTAPPAGAPPARRGGPPPRGAPPPGPAQPPMGTMPPPGQPTGPAAYPPPDQPQPFFTPMPPQGGVGPDEAGGGREPFFHWYTRKPIAWVGTGVAGAGLLVGVIFSIAAGSASASVDDTTAAIKDHAKDDPTTGYGQTPPCGSEEKSGTDLPGYEKACDTLRSDISDHDTDVAVAATGFVFMGVGILGTVAYAMIDWFPKKGSPESFAIAPIITPTTQGFGFSGRF